MNHDSNRHKQKTHWTTKADAQTKAKHCRTPYRPHVDPSITSQTSHFPAAQQLICAHNAAEVNSVTELKSTSTLQHLLCVLQLERPQSEVIPQRPKPRHQRCYCSNDWIICLSPALESSALRCCVHGRLGLYKQ